MNEILQHAINNLVIQDIFLRSSATTIKDGFDPKYNCDAESLTVQLKHLVQKHEVLKFENDEQGLQIFRVHIDLGARWIYVADNALDDGSDVLAQIEVTMVAEYQMQENPGQEALETFALRNASYHVWPYWREYLMSQAVRMNLPKTVLPAIQFAMNKTRDSVDKKTISAMG